MVGYNAYCEFLLPLGPEFDLGTCPARRAVFPSHTLRSTSSVGLQLYSWLSLGLSLLCYLPWAASLEPFFETNLPVKAVVPLRLVLASILHGSLTPP